MSSKINETSNTPEQVHQIVSELLEECTPKELTEYLSSMYHGYNSSDYADNKMERTGIYYSYTVLGEFFTKLHMLNKKKPSINE
ncbi:hypothetical protein ACE939_00920 [Aquimarina sp. W85]|uniref:hypothetical protein n=1 Tax=Aquimarina rhodophyticola TaxID=3342246 RepID=UPI00366AAC6A